MNIIETIALVIVVASLLVFITGWGYDEGFKSSRYENESLIRENRSLIVKSNLSQENYQRIQNSYSRLIDEMQRMDIDNNRLNAEINKLKKQEVYNNYNLNNEVISLHVENQRLKDWIKELERCKAPALKEEPKFEGANREKIESLRKIIEPIEEWINENACPHDKLIITQGNVEFVSGEFGIPLKIRD